MALALRYDDQMTWVSDMYRESYGLKTSP